MIVKFKGTTNCESIYIKNILFKAVDGSLIELDRNISEYVVEGGYFQMTWKACYANVIKRDGSIDHDFMLHTKDFKDAQIVEVRFNENAPRKYMLEIEAWAVKES